MKSKPTAKNLIYIHSHDLGRCLGCYGYPVKTPNLDGLARRGVLFRQAYCTAPTCTPSRVGLLTGQYPHQQRMFGLTNEGWSLSHPERHLAAFLGRHGFDTVLAGIQHVAPPEEGAVRATGYEQILHRPDHGHDHEGQSISEKAAAFLDSKPESPFFLDVGYVHTHPSQWDRSFCLSFDEFGPIKPNYIRPPLALPDTPPVRWETAMFYRSIEYLDREIGILLEALDRNGHFDDSIVLFTTDHGAGLPFAKINTSESGTGVALSLSVPGGASGEATDSLVSHLDLYPTFCEALGLETPDWCEGETLMPILRGETDRRHRAIFSEQTYHISPVPLRAVRTERFRYQRRVGPELEVSAYFSGPVSSDFLIEHLGAETMPKERIFDHSKDGEERRDFAADPRYKETLADLRSLLDRHLERTGDPALHDRIPERPPQPEWDAAGAENKKLAVARWMKRRRDLQSGAPGCSWPGIGEDSDSQVRCPVRN